MLSTIILIIYVVEFIVAGVAAHSVFFILTILALFDVIAGFSITIKTATRDIALGHKLAGARPHDLDDDILVDHHAFQRLGLVGDDADIGRAVALDREHAELLDRRAERGRQGLGADRGVLQAGGVELQLPPLLQQDLQEGGRAGIDGGTEIVDRLHLQLGIADAARKNRAADRMRAAFDHQARRHQVIREGVVHQHAGPGTGGPQRAREAPVVLALAARLVDRPRRLEDMAHLGKRPAVQPAERLRLPAGKPARL